MGPLCRFTRWLVLTGCAVIATLSMADAAKAGTYVIRNCNVPSAPRTPVGPWRWAPTATGTFGHDECASGGGFGIHAGTMPWGHSSGVSLETPPAIGIRRVRLWLVVKLQSSGSTLFSVVTSGNANVQNPVDLFGPPGGSTLATPYVSPLLAADTHIYFVLINCAGGTGAPCTAGDADVLDIRGVETTLEESTAPTGSIEGGGLMADAPQSGIRALGFGARDAESGVARVAAFAGGTVVGTADFAGDCAYAALAACPQVRNGSIEVDTRKVPDGIYPVSLRITDAAGNEQNVQASTAIRIVNGAAGTAGRQTVPESTGTARLSASFAANRRSTLTAGYGRRVVIRGRLQGADGVPIQGRVDVEERPASGGATRSGVIDTRPDGSFTHTVGRGMTRAVTLTYRGASTVSKRLRLRVRASATLRVRLNGIVVRYRGTVRSKPLPRNGKLVEIQGRSPGSAWRTFAQRRTNRRGGFSGTYRLRVHRPGVRLQFRVRIPSQRGYPYATNTGNPVAKRVR